MCVCVMCVVCVCVCVCVCGCVCVCECVRGGRERMCGMGGWCAHAGRRVCYVGDSIIVDRETNTGCAATHKDSLSYNMLFPRLTCRDVQCSCCSQT